MADLRAENQQLRAALGPFAELGAKLKSACASGAIPPGVSARFLRLEPLTAQSFVDAAVVFDAGAPSPPDNKVVRAIMETPQSEMAGPYNNALAVAQQIEAAGFKIVRANDAG